MHSNPSTELALRAFEADIALSAAMSEFQAEPAAGTIIEEAQRAATYGFSWFARPSEPGFVEVRLRHKAGAEISADGESITALLAGLLGYPLALEIAAPGAAQTAEPEKICDSCILLPGEQSAPEPLPAKAVLAAAQAQVAAESLAAVTGGVVVTEPSEYVPDPEQPLTNQEKADAEAMLRGFTPEKRKSFTISYRDAFRVPRDIRAILPTVTQWKHLQYFYNWETEASGGVAA